MKEIYSFTAFAKPTKAKKEENIVETTLKAMRDFIPADVTAFYLGFAQLAEVKENPFQSTVLLPVLGLAATIILRYLGGAPKHRAWLVLFSSFAFVSWVYASGGQFFGWALESTTTILIIFAFANLIIPAGYRQVVKGK